MITRDDVTAALAKLPELSPSATQPPVLAAGCAWPVWDHSEYANRGGCLLAKETWQVLVVLPSGDSGTTAAAGDALRLPVAEALLSAPAWVERAEPVQIQAEDGGAAVPALQFTISE